MNECKDIILAVDYHSEKMTIRQLNMVTGEERVQDYPTARATILRLVESAVVQAGRQGGRVRWLMESTTGWARVRELIGGRVDFGLVNVLQMPLPPKAHRRKSDKIDTGRMLREELNGSLPRAFQPDRNWRQARRLVDARTDLVHRQTQLKNWVSSLLHHETWAERSGLWSDKGRARLRALRLPDSDRFVLDLKLEQLARVESWLAEVEARMMELYQQWPLAHWVDQVRGIGPVTAVALLAHIGPVSRFRTAQELIAYAGLAPGYRQSSDRRQDGHIGGGGTDGQLRFLVIEATRWLREIPRYRATYERVVKKRGKKVAKLVLARLFLRSLHKMLKDRIQFNQAPAVAASGMRSMSASGRRVCRATPA